MPPKPRKQRTQKRPAARKKPASDRGLRLKINATPNLPATAERAAPTYQYETLARAIEAGINRKTGFVWKTWTVLTSSSAAIERGTLSLISETARQLEWHATFTGGNKFRASMRLITAKNHEAATEFLAETYTLLKRAQSRAPKVFPQPLYLGQLHLPDRHRRKSHARQIAAYTTRPIPRAAPCVLGKPGQLGALHDSGVALLSRDDSDAVKRDVLAACLAAYDLRAREGIVPPPLTDQSLRLVEKKGAPPRIQIAFINKTWQPLDQRAYLDRIVDFTWRDGDRREPLAPTDPAHFIDAVVKAVGRPNALPLLKQFLDRTRNARRSAEPVYAPGDLSAEIARAWPGEH